jgi:hypothetical protein
MAAIHKETLINGHLEKIYDYVSQPSNSLEFWPDLIDISDLKLLPDGGYSYRWKYKIFNIVFRGTGECISMVPKGWITTRNTGGIDCTITYSFRSLGDKTKVNLTVEYQVHIPVLSRWSEESIVKMNTQKVETVLNNLRNKFESES